MGHSGDSVEVIDVIEPTVNTANSSALESAFIIARHRELSA